MMSADLLQIVSLDLFMASNAHAKFTKLVNFMWASTLPAEKNGLYGCSTDHLCFILKIVQTGLI